MSTLLAVDTLTRRFGGLVAVNAVTLDLRRGELGSHMRRFMERYELLLTPTAPLLPPFSGSRRQEKSVGCSSQSCR